MVASRPSTAKIYRVSFRQLEPHFGGIFLDEINKTRLSSYVSARKKAGASDATIRRDLATLSCLCSCAVTWDFIETNPVRTFSKRHLREAPPKTAYPSDDQVDRLVGHASPMAGRLIRFLAHTGVRQEEACSLEWGQVSLERREVRLTKTKTSSPRVVPLSEEAIGTLLGTPLLRDNQNHVRCVNQASLTLVSFIHRKLHPAIMMSGRLSLDDLF